jgi:starvation-inducible DNA-binding protein
MKNNFYQETQKYILNLAIFTVKLKNIHWNITGLHFIIIHDYAQKLFAHFIESQDTFAELLKSQGQEFVLSLEGAMQESEIAESKSLYIDEEQALEVLLKDLYVLKSKLYHLRGMADVDANYTAATLLEDEMIFVDKQIWFVSAMIK